MTDCPSGSDPQTCGADPKGCSGCGPGQPPPQESGDKDITRTLKQIRHKILVMSGKGGVGKSSVAVSLALALARRGYKVGLMDVDLHGPNVLRMLGLQAPLDMMHAQFPLPPDLFDNLRVMSIEMLMKNREMAVIWRGPLKHQLIRQFLSEVTWGHLDYLVIDAPPGTGDEPMSVVQTIPEAHAVIVTTPQEISLADVRKSINFCQKVNLDILGLVENMSGYHCPHCGEAIPLFKTGGAKKTAQDAKVPLLGALPFDPKVVEAADQGELINLPDKDSPFFQALRPIIDYLLEVLSPTASRREPGVLRFALPVDDGKLAAKFGEAKGFAFFTVKEGAVVGQETVPIPPHEPGGIPEWLEDLGVTHVIAAGLGDKAQGLIQHKDIEVIPGNPQETPENLVQNFLKENPGPARQCSAP